jgi:F420-0:gamma-glutamyl ligase
MAKGKGSGKNYTSAGVHSNVSKKITNALRSEYLKSGERIMNQLRAFRQRKRVMVTIANPNPNDLSRRFIRVTAQEAGWK